MADFVAKKFTIDSTLELVADQFTVDLSDTVMFRNSSPSDRVTLQAGLLDASDIPVMLHTVVGAVIDEYEITFEPANVLGTIRGRDPSSAILDSFYEASYVRPGDSVYGAGQLVIETIPGFDMESVFAPARVGRTLASEIARDVVESVGLTLSWEVRDYELVETFEARGRIVDILRQLIEPWTLVEPFQVDILLQGTTVIIRHRQLPGQPFVADAQHTFDIKAARRNNLTARKRRLKKIGKVTLTGRKKPQGRPFASVTQLDNDGGGPGGGGTQTVEYFHEAFDQAGGLVQRTVSEDQFRVPDRILLRSVKTTFTRAPGGPLKMTLRETMENRWEPSLYDESGPVNSPKQLAQFLVREGIDPADTSQLFRVIASDEITFKYDDVGFLVGETTITRKLNLETGQLDPATMVIKTLKDVGSLFTEQITEQYRFDPDNLQWIIQIRDTAPGGGHRPGGPGRGIGGTAGLQRGMPNEAFDFERLEQTFSTDKDAAPVEYSNENLSLADLQFIMDQFAASVGLSEYELIFGGVAMPWLRRGDVVKFTGLRVAGEDATVELPAALMQSVRTDFDESRVDAKYTMECRAFAWAQ